ncbi:MAG TPA: hypothetical protein VFI44_06465, partial [Ornithinibacter sp.]|nr:hypothetical protein [Ornithinibacter sp.]
MTTAPSPSHAQPHARDQHDVRLAWACLVAAPFVTVLAFVAGEVLAAALGHDGVGAAPWWMALTVLLVAGALLAVPTLLAVRFARRARAAGDDRARVPAVILVVGTLAFVAVNLVSWVLMVLT